MVNNRDKNLPDTKTPERPGLRTSENNIGNVALSEEGLSQWRSQRMLFVSGPHASGKSSIIHDSLKEGFAIFDLGPLVRKIHVEQTDHSLSYLQWVDHNEAIHGPDFTSELLTEAIRPKLQNEPAPNGAVMVGNRSILGIEYFKRKFQPVDALIVYLEAPQEVLLERYRYREKRPNLSIQAFQAILNQDEAMGLGTVRDNADYVIDNSENLDAAQTKLQEIVDSWQPPARP